MNYNSEIEFTATEGTHTIEFWSIVMLGDDVYLGEQEVVVTEDMTLAVKPT